MSEPAMCGGKIVFPRPRAIASRTLARPVSPVAPVISTFLDMVMAPYGDQFEAYVIGKWPLE
jgi:hypothetical protein